MLGTFFLVTVQVYALPNELQLPPCQNVGGKKKEKNVLTLMERNVPVDCRYGLAQKSWAGYQAVRLGIIQSVRNVLCHVGNDGDQKQKFLNNGGTCTTQKSSLVLKLKTEHGSKGRYGFSSTK